MPESIDAITLRHPDDWHVHLRDGAMLAAVLPLTARQFARAIVMPNLVPPVTDVAAACAFARRRRLGPFRRAAADHARELGAFARAGFSRRVAEAVLACADISAVEALARGEPD